MKDSYYFQHDYNARNDEKILELRSIFGCEGYGIYWMLLESMAETEDGKLNLSLIGGLSLGYGVAKGRLSEIVEFCINVGLFEREMQFFLSKRMVEHKSFRVVCSKNGKAGALKRWGSYGDPNSKGKERKGKEINTVELLQKLTSEVQLELGAKACNTTLEAFTAYAKQKASTLIATTEGKYTASTMARIIIQDFEAVRKTYEFKTKPKTADDFW